MKDISDGWSEQVVVIARMHTWSKLRPVLNHFGLVWLRQVFLITVFSKFCLQVSAVLMKDIGRNSMAHTMLHLFRRKNIYAILAQVLAMN